MRLRLQGLTLALAGVLFTGALPAETTDPLTQPWEKIVKKATHDRKCILVAFLGDGWSVASKRFSEKVLESDVFKTFADANLVYCPIFARSNPRMSKEKTARLQSLVIYFDMQAYPSMILLSPDGTELMRHGYRDVSGEEYVHLLEKVLPQNTH